MELIIHSKAYGTHKVIYDDEDHYLIKGRKVRILKYNETYYAATSDNTDGKNKVIYLHLLVMGFPKSKVDHIDNNGLNNRKINLRVATHSQNLQNRGKSKNNTSGYKGVFYCKQTCKYRVILRANKKNYEGGRFDDKKKAALKYNELAIIYHNEFAKLNIV